MIDQELFIQKLTPLVRKVPNSSEVNICNVQWYDDNYMFYLFGEKGEVFCCKINKHKDEIKPEDEIVMSEMNLSKISNTLTMLSFNVVSVGEYVLEEV